MPAAADAILQDNQGRTVLRFERPLAHPPERVWEALTEPGEQGRWHPTPADFEPRAGGAVRYRAEGDVPDMADGEVIEYDPPRVLAHTWGEDELRWEIEPRDGGSLLVLTHTFDDHFKAARDAAGWHVSIDALTEALDGGAGRPAGDGASGPQDWKALNREYQERFGIPPEKATPPPNQGSG